MDLYNKKAMKSETFPKNGFRTLEILDLMCEMAEEAVKESEIETNDILRQEGIYTKKQVEELLLKQMILCSENATLCWKNEAHPNPYFAWNPKGKQLQGDLATHVNRDSILNSIYKFD